MDLRNFGDAALNLNEVRAIVWMFDGDETDGAPLRSAHVYFKGVSRPIRVFGDNAAELHDVVTDVRRAQLGLKTKAQEREELAARYKGRELTPAT